MTMLELTQKNRSYRSYDHSRSIAREELEELVELARFTPSSVNVQPLKYALVYEADRVARLQPHVFWAKKLKDVKLPPEGHQPTGFVVICLDTRVSQAAEAFMKDVGIVAQTMLLGAVEKGLGGCMIGNFREADVRQAVGLAEEYRPLLVLAIGKPDEEVILEDALPGADVSYYRDEHFVHHVPKRTASELTIPLK